MKYSVTQKSPFKITYSRFDLYRPIWTALDINPLLCISQCCVLLYNIGETYFSVYLAKREMRNFLQRREILFARSRELRFSKEERRNSLLKPRKVNCEE